MNCFWSNVFDHFKERRLGAVFFGALAVVVGLLLLGSAFGGFLQDWPMILPGMGVLLLAFIWRGIRQARARWSSRYKSSPLSRDERAKARSKLITKPTFKKS
jgi:hypothetical protein